MSIQFDAEKMKRELIAQAEFQIQHRAKTLIATKIDYDFNPSQHNKLSLEIDIRRLKEAENRLQVLSEMDFQNWENSKPDYLVAMAQ
jgi:hypothetical protein